MRPSWKYVVIIVVYVVTTTSTEAASPPSILPNVTLQWMNESCIGGERGLLSTGLWLTLNVSDGAGICSSNRLYIEYYSTLPDLQSNCTTTITNATFELEQPEHGGGKCHCVQVHFLNLPTHSFE